MQRMKATKTPRTCCCCLEAAAAASASASSAAGVALPTPFAERPPPFFPRPPRATAASPPPERRIHKDLALAPAPLKKARALPSGEPAAARSASSSASIVATLLPATVDLLAPAPQEEPQSEASAAAVVVVPRRREAPCEGCLLLLRIAGFPTLVSSAPFAGAGGGEGAHFLSVRALDGEGSTGPALPGEAGTAAAASSADRNSSAKALIRALSSRRFCSSCCNLVSARLSLAAVSTAVFCQRAASVLASSTRSLQVVRSARASCSCSLRPHSRSTTSWVRVSRLLICWRSSAFSCLENSFLRST
mmetsp:Transcript_16092/g.34074  ORF Transcript_16092/g.34074 Transcript_16092/m.34074 type:complete len:305 (+) Transcript_16092:205-1119(+)